MSNRNRLFAALLLCAVSCVQPLIENGMLNQERLADIVKRASAASGLEVLTPVTAELVNRRKLTYLQNRGAEPAGSHRINAGPLARLTMGAYLSDTQTVYLVSDRTRGPDGSTHLQSLGGLEMQFTLAHEVIHALQHQHYPHLFGADRHPEHQTDAAWALQAAIEGAAQLAAAKSFGYLGSPHDPEWVISSAEGPGGLFEDEEPEVREQFSFPYTYGYRLAYHEAGQLLDALPASTEQVFHSSSSGRRQAFVAIDLSPLQELVGSAGCVVQSEDTIGELGLRLWLRTKSIEDVEDVAEGWDGDRWISVRCADQEQVAWLTRWDTPEDAAEFEQAIRAVASTSKQGAAEASWMTERDRREVVVSSHGFPFTARRIHEASRRELVTTREELLAHFQPSD